MCGNSEFNELSILFKYYKQQQNVTPLKYYLKSYMSKKLKFLNE